MIEFLLNNELVSIDDESAQLTVLDFLREHRGHCGTKEGCASGDCGACTVVVAGMDDGKLRYQNCNSCITFLGSLHGKQLLTVEHLSSDGRLHPVQESMVVQHGSQCGFCTPGFVMSLFALYKNSELTKKGRKKRHNIDEFLGGNLCRCTGYKPILNAAVEAMDAAPADQFSRKKTGIGERLNRINSKRNPGTDTFFLPRSCKSLAKLLDQYPDARLLCGATDLALEVTQQLKSLGTVVYLGNVNELCKVSTKRHHYEIGAAVSLNDFSKLIKNDYPDLEKLLLRFGSRQIRNMGSIGGNIANASPIGDLPPVLIALNANLVLQSSSGKRTVPVEKFFLDYKKTALRKGEFLRSINLPRADASRKLKVYKISKRFDDDISALCVAINISLKKNTVEQIRIAFGGMAAIPKRSHVCEQALLGKTLDKHSINQARKALEKDFKPIDDVRASAKYRMDCAKNLLNRLQIELLQPNLKARVSSHG